MVKDLNDHRRDRSQKMYQVRSILEINSTCTRMFLEKSGLPAASTPVVDLGIPLAIVVKLATAQLE